VCILITVNNNYFFIIFFSNGYLALLASLPARSISSGTNASLCSMKYSLRIPGLLWISEDMASLFWSCFGIRNASIRILYHTLNYTHIFANIECNIFSYELVLGLLLTSATLVTGGSTDGFVQTQNIPVYDEA